MRKFALVGVVGLVASLVACAAAPDSTASATGADTTNTTATRTGNATGRTTATRGNGTRTSTTNADAGAVTSNGDAGAPLSCYANNGDCDPTNANACDPGATCDIDGSSGQFTCFPPPNDAKLGEACDNSQGPFCGAGMACNAGTCQTYCCDDSQCAAGTTCQQTGTVGFITVSVCQ